MKIKSFIDFINENHENEESFIRDIALKIIEKIRNSRIPESEEYSLFSGMEFTQPYKFQIKIFLKRNSNPNFKSDSHFKDLPWEEINFNEIGYSIDASVKLTKDKFPIKVVHLLINPKEEPDLYQRLFARIIDILSHESEHFEQIGVNREAFNKLPSHTDQRSSSKDSYKYFLLDEEVDAFVKGSFFQSQERKVPIDQIFKEYLTPFLKVNFITQDQFNQVINQWITRAVELYPNSKFSDSSNSLISKL